MSTREEWLRRVKDVERQCTALTFAVELFLNEVASRPQPMLSGIEMDAIRLAKRQLESTYFVRLFAEFEQALRSYWRAARSKQPPSRTRDLLDSVAAMRNVDPGTLIDAHAARDFRNSIVHHRDDALRQIEIGDARKTLCTYLSWLPIRW